MCNSLAKPWSRVLFRPFIVYCPLEILQGGFKYQHCLGCGLTSLTNLIGGQPFPLLQAKRRLVCILWGQLIAISRNKLVYTSTFVDLEWISIFFYY